jgi:hypothetical protein
MIHLMIAAARSQLGIQVFFFGIEFWLKWAHLGDRAKEDFIKTYLGSSRHTLVCLGPSIQQIGVSVKAIL